MCASELAVGLFVIRLARLLRTVSRARFRLLGLVTIKDIPTDRFNAVISTLIDDGWVKTYEYSGFDAWIDYGCIKLRRERHTLRCEWDNWTEGSIEGPPHELEGIANENGLTVTKDWRWSEYDDAGASHK